MANISVQIGNVNASRSAPDIIATRAFDAFLRSEIDDSIVDDMSNQEKLDKVVSLLLEGVVRQHEKHERDQEMSSALPEIEERIESKVVKFE